MHIRGGKYYESRVSADGDAMAFVRLQTRASMNVRNANAALCFRGKQFCHDRILDRVPLVFSCELRPSQALTDVIPCYSSTTSTRCGIARTIPKIASFELCSTT